MYECCLYPALSPVVSATCKKKKPLFHLWQSVKFPARIVFLFLRGFQFMNQSFNPSKTNLAQCRRVFCCLAIRFWGCKGDAPAQPRVCHLWPHGVSWLSKITPPVFCPTARLPTFEIGTNAVGVLRAKMGVVLPLPRILVFLRASLVAKQRQKNGQGNGIKYAIPENKIFNSSTMN